MGRLNGIDEETIRGILILVAIVLAFAIAGTLDYDEEVRHSQWMQETKEAGEWVMW